MASKKYGFKTTVVHRLCFFFDITFLQFFIPIAALLYDTFGGGRLQMYKWCVEWLGAPPRPFALLVPRSGRQRP